MTMNELLDRAQNILGPIGDEERARIMRFFREPSEATWDNIHGIIIRWPGLGTMPRTVWQAVGRVNPRFAFSPRVVRGKRKWRQVPDVFTVHRALRAVLLNVPARTWTSADFVPLSDEAMQRVQDAEAEKHL